MRFLQALIFENLRKRRGQITFSTVSVVTGLRKMRFLQSTLNDAFSKVFFFTVSEISFFVSVVNRQKCGQR